MQVTYEVEIPSLTASDTSTLGEVYNQNYPLELFGTEQVIAARMQNGILLAITLNEENENVPFQWVFEAMVDELTIAGAIDNADYLQKFVLTHPSNCINHIEMVPRFSPPPSATAAADNQVIETQQATSPTRADSAPAVDLATRAYKDLPDDFKGLLFHATTGIRSFRTVSEYWDEMLTPEDKAEWVELRLDYKDQNNFIKTILNELKKIGEQNLDVDVRQENALTYISQSTLALTSKQALILKNELIERAQTISKSADLSYLTKITGVRSLFGMFDIHEKTDIYKKILSKIDSVISQHYPIALSNEVQQERKEFQTTQHYVDNQSVDDEKPPECVADFHNAL